MTKITRAGRDKLGGSDRHQSVQMRWLTMRFIYSNVCHRKAISQTNHAERANAPHGSDPTLSTPVRGLPSIIASLLFSVLRGMCGSTDLSVGLGRFHFQMTREMC